MPGFFSLHVRKDQHTYPIWEKRKRSRSHSFVFLRIWRLQIFAIYGRSGLHVGRKRSNYTLESSSGDSSGFALNFSTVPSSGIQKRITDYLNNEEDLREEIRVIVRDLEKNARDILMILQNIHNENTMEENIIVSQYCARARELFEDVRKNYAKLAKVVPPNQYYRYHEQWRFVTQRLCFVASLIIYLEINVLVTKEAVAEILGVKNNREDGFHLDLEDYLLGLLQLSAELSRFAINSVTNGDYNRPIEIARFVNELNAGFRLLNLKNDILRKRFDGLKYAVKKVEEVVYDLSIRGLKPSSNAVNQGTEAFNKSDSLIIVPRPMLIKMLPRFWQFFSISPFNKPIVPLVDGKTLIM